MGKKRTTSPRRLAEMLIAKYPDRFKEDFGTNKKLVNKMMNLPSKVLRNKLAGYITRLKKKPVEAGFTDLET